MQPASGEVTVNYLTQPSHAMVKSRILVTIYSFYQLWSRSILNSLCYVMGSNFVDYLNRYSTYSKPKASEK